MKGDVDGLVSCVFVCLHFPPEASSKNCVFKRVSRSRTNDRASARLIGQMTILGMSSFVCLFVCMSVNNQRSDGNCVMSGCPDTMHVFTGKRTL